MSAHIARAQLLFQQSRFELAEQELKQALAIEPQNAWAHALLALCLLRQGKASPATEEAREAVHLAPDISYTHYVLAVVFEEQRRFADAERHAQEALRLEPNDVECFALLAGIRLQQRRWQEALAFAQEALARDPEHVHSNNIRAMALVKLGRRQEAGATIQVALAKDPENAVTHANQGWALLEQGRPKEAMEHFREALRLNPQLEWARAGIVEAMKARNVIYRPILQYFFWMSRFNPRTQWIIVLGGYFGFKLLRSLAQSVPMLAPVIWPLLILYFLFALMTWIGDPLFNLILRCDRFGRLALSREQMMESNWIGLCFLAGLACVILGWFAGWQPAYGIAAGCVAMVIPIAGTYSTRRGRGRKILAWYTLGLGAVGALTIMLLVFSPKLGAVGGLLFWLAWIIFTWVANGIKSATL